MDADGFITIVDRIKELVITGGFNVAPDRGRRRLARIRRASPTSRSSAFRAHATASTWSRRSCAKPGKTVDDEGSARVRRENLAAYKVPRRVYIVDELPKSLIGKVLRKKVKEELLARDDAAAE